MSEGQQIPRQRQTGPSIVKTGSSWAFWTTNFGGHLLYLESNQQVCVQLPTSADNVALPAVGSRTPLLRRGCC